MTVRKRRSDRSGRGALPSPGRPSVARREDHRQFWAAIAAGRSSEDAAVGAGVSPTVGARWSRRAAACHHHSSRRRRSRCQGVICRLQSGRRSRSGAHNGMGCARSPAGDIDVHGLLKPLPRSALICRKYVRKSIV